MHSISLEEIFIFSLIHAMKPKGKRLAKKGSEDSFTCDALMMHCNKVNFNFTLRFCSYFLRLIQLVQNILQLITKFPTYLQVFTTKRSLTAHIQQVHVGDRPFVCPQCGKVIIDREINILHCIISQHTNHFQAFKREQHMQNHVNFVHATDQTAVKSKCPQCGKVKKVKP